MSCEHSKESDCSSKPADEMELVRSHDSPLGIELVNSRSVHRFSDHTDLVDLAKQVQLADEFVRANASSKLCVIAEQIKQLQQQAHRILREAQRDNELNHVACNLVKRPGTTYYLYVSDSTGQRYFSMLSPQDWGASCPRVFLGGYRLELDRSWTPVTGGQGEVVVGGDGERAESTHTLVDRILNARLGLACPAETTSC